MKFLALTVPLLFLLVFLYAAVKKVRVYDAFVEGVKGAIPLVVNIFPYIAAMFMLTELFERSGLSAHVCSFLTPFFEWCGIPKEIIKLALVKPFSGTGATALMSEVIEAYGADSYIARCATVCYGSSDTVFYVGAVYFSSVKNQKLGVGIAISLLCSFIALVMGCLLCRIM